MSAFLRDLIRPAAGLPAADVCLVGLPLDFGTVLEGGRAGAASAPDAIRRELRRYLQLPTPSRYNGGVKGGW